MDSSDFIELQILIAKLKIVSRKAASTDKAFKKYHQSSIAVLETIPQHLTSLQQGLSIVKPIQKEEINQSKGVRKKELELVI